MTVERQAKKQSKNLLLQTYLTSLLSLVLCMTMFFGTTMAWFTSEVESANNEIYVGTLDVAVENASVALGDGRLQVGEYASLATSVLFNGSEETTETVAAWEPGHTQIEALKVTNTGDLAFNYKLNLLVSGGKDSDGEALTEKEILAVASQMDVYIANTEAALEVVNYDALKNSDAWTCVGTLEDAITNNLVLAANRISQTKDSDVVYIALHMRDSAVNTVTVDEEDISIMGKTLNINVKLVANQAIAESDAFGPGYDNIDVLYIGKDEIVTLSNTQDPLMVMSYGGTLVLDNVTITATDSGKSALTVMAGSDLTLVINGETVLTGAMNGDGIEVQDNAKLTLTETSVTFMSENAEESAATNRLVVVGNAGKEYLEGYGVYTTPDTDSSYASTGGSGIGGEGTIVINGMSDLTALGYGKHGFGIGGHTASITITDSTITEVKGGYANDEAAVGDTKYAKDDPEGGAAIGSSCNGAEITLQNVRIISAEGGSKSAGIGAFFHVSVEITLDGCTIDNVVGGVSAAAIGGSRVGSVDPAEQDITITIKDSKITAQGGYYGAGIGSGYDTYCHTPEQFPMCTINITGESVINATGGKYAAGVGTGYHAGGLAGEIADSVTVNAAPGDDYYKDAYTLAQDVGFGVIDPARDGLNNDCYITYHGTKIYIPVVDNTEKVDVTP